MRKNYVRGTGLVVEEDPTSHGLSKFIGGNSAFFLAGAFIPRLPWFQPTNAPTVVTVATEGISQGSAPFSIVRTIGKGEKIINLINEGKELTYLTGHEHAVVKLADGTRAIVSGGPGGISFAEGSVARLYCHTHPYHVPPTGPSAGDFEAIRVFGQKSSWLLEHGELIKFFR